MMRSNHINVHLEVSCPCLQLGGSTLFLLLKGQILFMNSKLNIEPTSKPSTSKIPKGSKERFTKKYFFLQLQSKEKDHRFTTKKKKIITLGPL